MNVQIIEVGKVNTLGQRFGYSLKINGKLVPMGIVPHATFAGAKQAMMTRVRKETHVRVEAERVRLAAQRAVEDDAAEDAARWAEIAGEQASERTLAEFVTVEEV